MPLPAELSEDEELDDRAIAAVKELDEDTALQVLKHFCESDLSYVQNKSAYLCGAIKMFRTKGKNVGSKPEPEKINGPDEAKIKVHFYFSILKLCSSHNELFLEDSN